MILETLWKMTISQTVKALMGKLYITQTDQPISLMVATLISVILNHSLKYPLKRAALWTRGARSIPHRYPHSPRLPVLFTFTGTLLLSTIPSSCIHQNVFPDLKPQSCIVIRFTMCAQENSPKITRMGILRANRAMRIPRMAAGLLRCRNLHRN